LLCWSFANHCPIARELEEFATVGGLTAFVLLNRRDLLNAMQSPGSASDRTGGLTSAKEMTNRKNDNREKKATFRRAAQD